MKTKNEKQKKLIQYACFYTLATLGLIAFMVVAGDDDPYNPMPLSEWFLIKGAAAAACWLIWRIGKVLDQHGYMPEFKDDDLS